MLNNQYELFLSEYFFCRCVLGKVVKDKYAMFDTLAEVFIIDPEEHDALFALTEDETVADIKTYGDYLRFCRIKKYGLLTGEKDDISSDIDEVISAKGEALKRAHELELDGAALTQAAVLRAVTERASLGIVSALRVLGYIQCEGILGERDKKAGIKNLEKAAMWNSVEGMLFALYYNPDNREADLGRLRAVSSGAYRSFIAAAENRYDCHASAPAQESALLSKAFALGKLKPDRYAAQYARIVFSPVLTPRDKERTMFSVSEQNISDIADLPLKLTRTDFAPELTALSDLPIAREKEVEHVRRCLANSDLLYSSSFRPLCVCADSEYLRKLYARHIRAAFGAHVEYIDIAGLDEYDLQPTGKNLFVRSCDEDAFNVYFMSFTGNIAPSVMQEAIGFLQSRRRKKFCLQSPGVVIDLSAILPVCFCDKTNAKELKKYCDVVTLSPVAADEKSAMYADIIQTKQKLYGVKSVTIDDSGAARLSALSVDGAESVIDAVVRFNRGSAETVITSARIDECALARTEKNRYGFGGDGDEI
ncbi:MAG: hypothetical protein K2O04_07485 [Clostridiales bacterium]|nr:hypothetical protein [Clostridiales bacterium]